MRAKHRASEPSCWLTSSSESSSAQRSSLLYSSEAANIVTRPRASLRMVGDEETLEDKVAHAWNYITLVLLSCARCKGVNIGTYDGNLCETR